MLPPPEATRANVTIGRPIIAIFSLQFIDIRQVNWLFRRILRDHLHPANSHYVYV